MIFEALDLPGAYKITLEAVEDERGAFARTFCAREMERHGLTASLAQASQSYNIKRGTLRGLHFQSHPAMEDKIIRCVKGAIFDVLVDIRPGSPGFGRWFGCELSEGNNVQLYAPKGFAHGFQTLRDETMVLYHIAQFYEPERTAGIRHDDPDIGVNWPLPPVNVSARDAALPRLADINRSDLLYFRRG